MDRLELHQVLVKILGSNNVYYQPPQSFKLKYPCIIYSREKVGTTFADDKAYDFNTKYKVTVVYTDPDDKLVYDILANVPMCTHDSHFVSDNLYHDALTIYTT